MQTVSSTVNSGKETDNHAFLAAIGNLSLRPVCFFRSNTPSFHFRLIRRLFASKTLAELMKTCRVLRLAVSAVSVCMAALIPAFAEPSCIYGIHDHEPNPSEFLNHITAGGAESGWVTATVAVGADTNDMSGVDFTFLSNQGHTVICRINHSYFPGGTIPLPAKYDAFAARCANFVAHSHGCSMWIIGNELNIAGEWPADPVTLRSAYVAPTAYAACFRKVYDAIKAVQPHARIMPQASAPFSGPFGEQILPYAGTNYISDPNPLNWVQYENQMLTAIKNTGPLDGIALHVYSRGYNCADIHSTQTRSAAGQSLYFSFYCYKDWVNLAIPSDLYHLPLYITECNGYYFWKGGHHENPAAHYEPGWIQEVYAEINRYNESAFASGKPVFRCVNLYRWCAGCDGWNIDGDNPYKGQMMSDLDQAIARKYRWPTNNTMLMAPLGLNFIDPGGADDSIGVCSPAGVVPQSGWFNLSAGGNGSLSLGGGASVTWSTPGGGTHALPIANSPPDFALMHGYLDTGDTSLSTVTVIGLPFPLYDIIVYTAGDNGSAIRVARFTLNGSHVKYVKDTQATPDFTGSYIEADSSTGGPFAPAGNYCRFRNVRGSTFSLTAQGEYASDAHPRAPMNAIQIIPSNVVPLLAQPTVHSGQFHFALRGATNANYVIQASPNLRDWTAILTTAAPSSVSLDTPGDSRHFYRALFQ